MVTLKGRFDVTTPVAQTTGDYALPTLTLQRLLIILAITLGPHAPHMPIWCSAAVAALIAWRACAAIRQWRLPPKLLRWTLAIGAFVGVYGSYGQVSGQTAGVALLAVMAALKLTEMRTRRDVIVLVYLMYFLLVTHFFFSQEPWTIVYLLVCVGLISALLADVHHVGRPLPLGVALRVGAAMSLQALPLMILLFFLFPRIPGPIWGIPADAGANRSGLSEEMTPGDIEKLALSDAVAFRVRFDGPPPPAEQRYWRGPVLEHFDGRGWKLAPPHPESAAPAVELKGPAVRYEVVLEASNQPWLFAMELPDSTMLPPDAHLDENARLLVNAPVSERRLYTLVSHARYLLQPELLPRDRERALRLPPSSNPETYALAARWRAEGQDDATMISSVLKLFNGQDFYYTLEPPPIGHNAVDDFLFRTHRGFCEHYASSFAVLMRAAGIPARVVTGYVGGETNPIGEYQIVRQSDAHAWDEVWLEGRGWVRVDPTAAVAPQRVEAGIVSTLEESDASGAVARKSSGLKYAIEARWDWVNAGWERWVLGYGPELQHELLGHFGLDDWSDLILTMTVSICLVLGLWGALLLRQSRRIEPKDPVQRVWARALRRLARSGIKPGGGEGPRDFAARAAAERPAQAEQIDRIVGLYLRLRYLSGVLPQSAFKDELNRLAAAVSRLG